MIREAVNESSRDHAMIPVSIGAASLLGVVTLALLPNGYEADVVKHPVLVCGAVLLCGIFLTAAFLRRRLSTVRTSADVLVLLLLLLTVVPCHSQELVDDLSRSGEIAEFRLSPSRS